MGLGPASSHLRILIVEDEPLVRMFNVDALSEAGFEVLEACDADEALQLLEAHHNIDVVLTDVEMPGQFDGFALADAIEVRWPEIGVVITSGRRFPKTGLAAPARCFVPKPFNVTQLVESIGHVAQSCSCH